MSINVLIIDDSIFFRKLLTRGIETDPSLHVVGAAADGYQARDLIQTLRPDVITCDIQMPKIDGVELIRHLVPQYPAPIICISSASTQVFDAVEAGAVDYMIKPDTSTSDTMPQFFSQLCDKIKAAYHQTYNHYQPSPVLPGAKVRNLHTLLAIGASTGGTEAIYHLLKQLPKGMPPIVIVQHIPPTFSGMFAKRLDNQTHFTCCEARSGMTLKDDCIYVAPGDYHMEVRSFTDRPSSLILHQRALVNGHRPSVDVLFNSVAKYFGKHAVGVILTGMGMDGANGLLAMRQAGAVTLGQDHESSVVYGMPKVAYDIGGVVKQAPLSRLGAAIVNVMK